MVLELTLLLILLAGVGALSWFIAPGAWARLLLAAGRKAAGLRSRVVEVDGLRWHYLEGGHGPVLVALHGFGADADHWLRVGRHLRGQFRIIAPDLIGFGTSSGGEQLEFDMEAQAERLEKLLDALGVEQCTLAGNSMGGWVAAVCAARNPSRVRALWLLAPLGVKDCPRGELLEAIDDGSRSPLRIASLKEFEQRVFRPMFANPPPLLRPLRVFYGRRALRRKRALQRIFEQVQRTESPLEATVSRLKMPILLHWGDQDRAVDVSGANQLAKAADRIETSLLQDVGHLPMLEAPALSARQFVEFARQQQLGEDYPVRQNPPAN